MTDFLKPKAPATAASAPTPATAPVANPWPTAKPKARRATTQKKPDEQPPQQQRSEQKKSDEQPPQQPPPPAVNRLPERVDPWLGKRLSEPLEHSATTGVGASTLRDAEPDPEHDPELDAELDADFDDEDTDPE